MSPTPLPLLIGVRHVLIFVWYCNDEVVVAELPEDGGVSDFPNVVFSKDIDDLKFGLKETAVCFFKPSLCSPVTDCFDVAVI